MQKNKGMARPNVRPNDRRSLVLRLLRDGLISVQVAALSAEVSVQRVRQWCEAAGIDPGEAAKARMLALIKAETGRMARRWKPKRKSKRQSKAALRAETQRLVAQYEQRREPV